MTDRDTRALFKALLLDQAFWRNEENRNEFVNSVLWGHEALKHWSGSANPDVAAGNLWNLLDTYTSALADGVSPLCAVLTELRSRGADGGSRSTRIPELQRRLGCSTHRIAWKRAPYPGLLFLDHEDWPIFFGREAETRHLLRELSEKGRRLLVVTGSSGSGKSSLVRAGLWASLERGEVSGLPGTKDWIVTPMFPSAFGDDPFLALAAAVGNRDGFDIGEWTQILKHAPERFVELVERVLDRSPSHAEWLLLLDQMEELFTSVLQENREKFIDLLLMAQCIPRFRIVATLRSDFLDRCIDHPGLCDIHAKGGFVGLPHAGPLALARMVKGPVENLDLGVPMAIEEALVERIVEAVGSKSGGLALMAFALPNLYELCREQGVMDLRTYESKQYGGIEKAIGRHAQKIMQKARAEIDDLDEVFSRVFSRLVRVQPDGTPTRRRETREWWTHDENALQLIDLLSDAKRTSDKARLLVTEGANATTIEVAHEALLREWTELAQWIKARGDAINLREVVESEARIWASTGQKTSHRMNADRLCEVRSTLAGAHLLEDMERDPVVEDYLLPDVDRVFAHMLCDRTGYIDTASLVEVVETYGDPRLGVGLTDSGLPDIFWRLIPDGQVTVRDHSCTKVEPFYLSAYPITEAQFHSFMLDINENYERWRSILGFSRWGDALGVESGSESMNIHHHQIRSSRLVTGVDWFVAMTFCDWISARTGKTVKLPTEAQWQWAAQSAREDFRYPWGTQTNAVCDPKRLEQLLGIPPVAVGLNPHCASKQGVFDLVSTHREWCLDSFDDIEKVESEPKSSRVLRGGPDIFARFEARPDLRFFPADKPGFPPRWLSFRVACFT
ncbi:MAG: formylglycine-generating enzyme family protein [Gammaproteobacteria bacterium]